jgi:uncharacterized protein YhaN
MQFILSEQEHEELVAKAKVGQRIKDEHSSMQSEIDSLTNKNGKLYDSLVTAKKAMSEKERQTERRFCSRTLNIGTYDRQTADVILEALAKLRKNPNISTSMISRVRRLGRGKRNHLIGGKMENFDSSLPLSLADGVAIYIDMV